MIVRPRPVLVSILLPIFNAHSTLDVCLRSLQRQTLTDWECLLIDDGSTDGSLSHALRLVGDDPRFIPVKRAHVGLVATLNSGIELCQGCFVARMDADDVMHRQRLELQVAAFQTASQLDLVGCHVRFHPRSQLSAGLRDYETWLASIRTPGDLERDAYIECPLAHPTWMLRRERLTQLRYREMGWPEDYDLLLRLLQSGGKAGVVPRRLLGWRDSPQRLSRIDPRYAIDRFTACRAAFLASGPLADTSDYLLWGHGGTGRALRAALATHGKQMRALIEIHPGRQGQKIHGAPVVAPSELHTLPRHKLIVSVSGIIARTLIRDQLTAFGWRESLDYICAA